MTDKEFLNKCVLVTGGSKGIGKSVCELFAKKGATVIFTFRKKDKSVEIIKKYSKDKNYKIYGYQINNLSNTNLKNFLKKIKKNYKKINYLVNNIGDAIKRSKFIHSSDDLWIKSLDINLMSAVRISKHILNVYKNDQLDGIINIGSIAGKTFGQGDSLHYGVAKSALHGFTLGLSKELENTRVNCVAPNAVKTNFQKRLSSKKRILNIMKKNKLGRLANTEEVAELVVFLCSKKASYINGEIIYMTGGLK